MAIHQRPLAETERPKITWVEVEDARHFSPWSPQPISMSYSRLMKAYIQIIDYAEDGALDYSTREYFRLRVIEDGRLGLLHPEDDEEPDIPPG